MSARLIITLCLFFCLAACTSVKNKPVDTTAASSGQGNRSYPENIRVIENIVKRDQYENALKFGGNLNRIRLPEIYVRGLEGNEKQYRFFDVKPNSVYEMLGIENADVLVSVEGYMVPNQEGFYGYISLLHKEKMSNIEVLRNGAPLLLKNTFVP